MRTLKFLIEKEFKQLFRNKLIPRLIVLFPTIVMLIFPWTINFEIKNIRIDVIDHSKSSYSKRLTDKISASQYFILNDIPPDYQTAIRNMEKGETKMILEIPVTFDRDIIKNQTAAVGVAINSVNGTLGILGGNYITQIVNDFSAELRDELIYTIPSQTMASMPPVPDLEITPRHRFNPELDYKNNMIPGFMVLLMTMICGILPALNIVSEKETGTINQINVTPVNKTLFIIAKVIPFWVIGLTILGIAVTISWLLYGLWPVSGILPVFLSGFIFLFSVSGMGIIISNYSDNMQQASFLVMFFILIIILLSGLFTPISSMPAWAQMIAAINPFTYLTKTLRLLFLNGSTISDISENLLILGIFAILLNCWAVISYKKRG